MAAHDITNTDLIWELDHLSLQRRATEFIQQFENKICIYSPTVKQLYSNYSIYFPQDGRRSMVVLPNPYAFHDTFNYIPMEAIKSTRLNILPGDEYGKKGVYMVETRKEPGKHSLPIPFKQGLKQVLAKFGDEEPFLPVILKGALRDFDAKRPCLHLHRLSLSALPQLSSLERNNIKTTIVDKAMSIIRLG